MHSTVTTVSMTVLKFAERVDLNYFHWKKNDDSVR